MSRQRPKAPGQRQLRMGEEIRHALAWIFEREDFRDPALAGRKLTVTEVRPSPDLRHARVYIVPLGGGDPAPILKGLHRVKTFLRRRLGEHIVARYVPDLTFSSDESFDRAAYIASLMQQPEVARDLGPRTDEDDESPRTAAGRDEEE